MKRIIYTALFMGGALLGSAQVTPNTQTVPNATTQTLNPIPSAYSASVVLNYIETWEAQKPFAMDSLLSSPARTVQEVKQATQYMDGLGRPIQTVAKGVTPSGYDLVSPHLYDAYGREVFKYLPYADSSADGNFKSNPFAKQANFDKSFYNPTGNANGEKFFYGQTVFEPSALDRPTNTYAPGNSWVGRGAGISIQYLVNTAADSVVIWNIAFASGSVPVSGGYYPAGQLHSTVTVDERGYSAVEYKDKDGHLVLKKVQPAITGSYAGPTGWLNTYYVYDDYGNLRFVIQPKGTEYLRTHSWTFDAATWATSTIAKELCFSYEYDQRNRTSIKRIPGASEVWMVYDARDRLVMTQDSSLRAQGEWGYTDYDSLNRPVLTGLWASSGNQSYQEGLAYTSVTYPNPTSGYTVLTQTYYDDYSWVNGTGSGLSSSMITTYNTNTNYFAAADDNNFPYPRAITATNLTKGMVTGTKANVINTTTYLYSVSFYDDRTRLIETQSTNYTGSKDTAITQYAFNNSVLNTLVCHGKGGTNPQGYKVSAKTSYDAAYRVVKTTQKTGNSPTVTIAQNQYDELGELLVKKIGETRNSLTDTTYSGNPIDSLFYTYNIRGWLRGINKDYANAVTAGQRGGSWFGMELDYDYGFTQTFLNGDIAGIKWRNAEDAQQRAYGFSYDGSNRLTKADFTQYTSSAWNTSAGIDYSVHYVYYDQNGNITGLTQMGVKVNTSTLIDSLIYGYNTNSNQLNYVTDKANDTTAHLGDFTEINNNTTQDYYWDGNGNLTRDNNKKIANIHYNYLNLPDSITVTGKGSIKYVYEATGIKLQKIVTDTAANPDRITRTDYAGPFVYQNDTLQYVGTAEGRVRPKRANYSDTMYYDYFEKDHLGNTRAVLTDEKQQDIYPAATLETFTGVLATEEGYYTINTADTISTSRIASWGSTANNNYKDNNGNPPVNNDPAYAGTLDTTTSKIVYRLNGSTGDKTGLGITLKVMAGDAVSIYGKSFWHNNGTVNNGYPISAAVSSLVTAFTGTSAVTSAGKGGGTAIATDIDNNTIDIGGLKYLLDTAKASTGSTPRAYINWILFDDQFNPVKSGSGFDLINTAADNVKTHNIAVNIAVGGYLYVYCSNESNTDVFFDNLQLIDTRGPLLETDNYYPFGLTMAGISSQAAGKLENLHKFNKGSELQHKEFSDGSGLEVYDTRYRQLDPQIGRWNEIDPKIESDQEHLSPYQSMGDDPILYNDPDGDCPVCALVGGIVGGIIGGGVEAASQLYHSGHITSWKAVAGSAAQGVITGAVAGATGGASLLVTVGTSAAANVVGGAVNNVVQGKAITVKSVTTDAIVGAAAGLGGKLIEKGAAALQVAKTAKALKSLASEAKDNVLASKALLEGEKGYGTAVHTEFKKLVDAAGLKGVKSEASYLGKDVAEYGTKGSVRADAVLYRNGKPIQIFDLKTGSATLSVKQTNNYIYNVPGINQASQITTIR